MAAEKFQTQMFSLSYSLLLLGTLHLAATTIQVSPSRNGTAPAVVATTTSKVNAVNASQSSTKSGKATIKLTSAPIAKAKPSVPVIALKTDDLDGRSAFINNEYVPDFEQTDNENTPPLYQLFQQQMDQMLASTGAAMINYIGNKQQLPVEKQTSSSLYAASEDASSNNAYTTMPKAPNSSSYVVSQHSPSNGYVHIQSAPNNNYADIKTSSISSYVQSSGSTNHPTSGGYTMNSSKEYLENAESEEENSDPTAAGEMITSYAQEQDKLFHSTSSKAPSTEIPKPINALTHTYGGAGIVLRPNEYILNKLAAVTKMATTTSTTVPPTHLSAYGLPPLPPSQPTIVPLVEPTPSATSSSSAANGYALAAHSKYTRSNNTIHMRKRRITFKTVSSGSQIISTPVADLMFKFSIGIAKPTMASASSGNAATALRDYPPLLATNGYSGNLDLPKNNSRNGLIAKSSGLSKHKEG